MPIRNPFLKPADARVSDTPLLRALKGGDTENIWIALRSDDPVDCSVKDEQGKTPLMYAIHTKEVRIVAAVLRFCKPDDISAKDNDGNSALLHAAAVGHDKILDHVLASCRAEDMSVKDKFGNTALMRAIMFANVANVRTILKHCPPKDALVKDTHGRTALDHMKHILDLHKKTGMVMDHVRVADEITRLLVGAALKCATKDFDKVYETLYKERPSAVQALVQQSICSSSSKKESAEPKGEAKTVPARTR